MDEDDLLGDPRITTFGRLVEAHARLTHLLGEELEEATSVPLLWYGVLLHIGRSPGGVRPMGELINATAFTSGGVTRLVDRMEAAGYVQRRPCPTDRRIQYVGLTETGRETLLCATEVHLRGIQRYIMDVLGPSDVGELDALLARLVSSGDTER